MDVPTPTERPPGFAETQDGFLPHGNALRGNSATDHELIRRLARERMLAREGAAGQTGPVPRGRSSAPAPR
jgi:hypothetical protein